MAQPNNVVAAATAGAKLLDGVLTIEEIEPIAAPGSKVYVHYNGPTDQLSGVCTGMATLEPGASPHPPHRHPEEEFLIVSDGTGEIECDGKITHVGPGSIMYCAGGTLHGITNTGGTQMTFYWSKWMARPYNQALTATAEGVFHHAQITVTDIDRARTFYKDLLGFREMDRPSFPHPGAWFEMGNGHQLHLVRLPFDPLWRSASQLQIYETHLALRVPNFHAAVDRFRSAGYREDLPDDDPHKMVVRLDSPTGYPQVYVLDPDGHMIEFNAAIA